MLPPSLKINPIRHIRWFAILLLIAATTLFGQAAIAAAKPKPVPHTIPAVRTELNRLARGAERLAEKYNDASAKAAAAAKQARLARERAQAAVAQVTSAHRKFLALVTAQFEGGSFGATGALLTSTNPQSYLDELASLNVLSFQQATTVSALERAEHAARQAETQAAATLKTAQHRRAVLAGERREVIARTATYKRLLSTLTAAQQRAYRERDAASRRQAAAARRDAARREVARRDTAPARQAAAAPRDAAPHRSSTQATHAGSSAAQRAVQFALAQIGKPYVFGAAGPGSYDCSGLTMAAWRQGGVSLPHLASAQYNYGTHVSVNALRPGDLVFFYHPIEHVTIYIGRGLMVSAPQTGENVKIVPLSYFMSDYAGATRLS